MPFRKLRGYGLIAVAVFGLAFPAFGASPVRTNARTSGRAQEPAAFRFDVEPTVFYVELNGGFSQRLDVIVANDGPEAQGELKVKLGTTEQTFRLGRLATGKISCPIYLPEVRIPVPVKYSLKMGEVSVEKDATLNPQRKWTIYLFHHSHTDIGYTELQTRVAANHADYLDSVIEYCRATENYPDDAKFRWNIEVAWALDEYVRRRPESKVRELIELIQAGRVELGAWFLNQSDCFSHEELIRSVFRARELGRKYGFRLQAAMNDDVTGFSWAAPQVLRQAGIKYFTTGINETRSRAPLRRPCAFYWESPDGSRILHWNGEHYLFANMELSLHEGLDKSVPKVGAYLAGLEKRGDYPFDSIAFNISAWTTDNCPPGKALSDRVRDWNNKWAYPKLRLATMSEFFERFEAKNGPEIPVQKLGWPDYWTDGVASTAFETGLNRLAHGKLLTGEKVSAIAGALDPKFSYPGAEINEAYRNTMLFDEHTWGADNSIDEPQSELARGQWTIKAGFAYAAKEAAETILKRGLAGLAGQVRTATGQGLVVFNPLSWPRTDIVRVALPASLREKEGRFRILDTRSGQPVNIQFVDKGTLIFAARDIPALGYAVLTVDPNGLPVPPAPTSRFVEKDNTIENAFYKVVFDPVSGGILSVFDKVLKRELVDKSAPYALNTYIHEMPEGGRKAVDNMETPAAFSRETPKSAKIAAGLAGPVATSAVVRSSARMCPVLEQEVILYDDLKRVDIVNRLQKQETYDPEAVYFAFPFEVKDGAYRFEIADADMAPDSEQLPRTTRDWHTVQNWVEIANGDFGVVWSSVEAPLVQFGDINTGKWLEKMDLSRTAVYSYAMNNYWMTNFKAAQGGLVTFRYSLASRLGGPDRIASSRFGWETHAPLAAAWVPAGSQGGLEHSAGSFFSVDKANVIIQAVKRAEDGNGIVLRLREIAGRAADVRVTSPFLGLGLNASTAGLMEDEGDPLEVKESAFVVGLQPFEIKTILIHPGQ